jgi:hypothetical protein
VWDTAQDGAIAGFFQLTASGRGLAKADELVNWGCPMEAEGDNQLNRAGKKEKSQTRSVIRMAGGGRFSLRGSGSD